MYNKDCLLVPADDFPDGSVKTNHLENQVRS